LEKIKKIRNKNAEVFEEEIIEYLDDHTAKPFNIEHHTRKMTNRQRRTTKMDTIARSRMTLGSVMSREIEPSRSKSYLEDI
jgi:hypothetical protein